MLIVISQEEATFVTGWDINDNILLAQELIHHLDKHIWGTNVIFKLDIIKAFDRVSWLFLRKLHLQFGFHSFFVDLVMNHLSAKLVFYFIQWIS